MVPSKTKSKASKAKDKVCFENKSSKKNKNNLNLNLNDDEHLNHQTTQNFKILFFNVNNIINYKILVASKVYSNLYYIIL